ncbi:MAG: tRNA dihydrouridine synthase DusB [Alphaproteobacteria bacterium]|nr:tRNA dihydrouridine synthase DusB [Alphaproteobacteria bacterium]
MTINNLDSKVFLAPMAGITDKPMRRLVNSFGKGNIVSEMVAINALSFKNPKTYKIADVRDENYPVIVQLVGGNPELFVDSVKLAQDLGAYSIDINMGCPVKKIVSNKSGSYLMKDTKLASEIITSVKNATSLPVSVKFRKGWDNNSVNAVEFAKMCEDCGADYITVHGRTRSDFYSGVADWDIIAEVKNAVKIKVIGNGDVDTPKKAKELLEYTKADGVMIGRATLGRPWLIAQTHEFLENGTEPEEISLSMIKETLLRHINWLADYYGERLALGLSRKYVCWYCKNLRDARKFREKYVRIDNMEQALIEINTFFNEENYNKEETI